MTASKFDLHNKMLAELRSFCNGLVGDVLHRYLYNNWYGDAFWRLWGIRNRQKSFSFLDDYESRSSLVCFKRAFLLQFNRLWIILPVHIIASDLLLNLENDNESSRIGPTKPMWWKQFSKSLKNYASVLDSGFKYKTPQQFFTCNCPYWIRNQYFFGSNEFKTHPAPVSLTNYLEKRSIYSFNKCSSRIWANISEKDVKTL